MTRIATDASASYVSFVAHERRRREKRVVVDELSVRRESSFLRVVYISSGVSASGAAERARFKRSERAHFKNHATAYAYITTPITQHHHPT